MDYIKTYIAMMAAFLALDGVWLGLVAKSFYKKYIGDLMATNPNFFAAGLFYSIYLVGLLVLVVIPAVEARSLAQALVKGALFGLVCYATYDLTSQAVIKNWPWTITLVDLAWGTGISIAIAAVGYWALSNLV